MTRVKDKTHYTMPDLNTMMAVLMRTELQSCFEGLPSDLLLFRLACLCAAHAVPFNDPPRGAFNRDAYVRQRLQEALAIRNRYYRDHLPKETMQ